MHLLAACKWAIANELLSTNPFMGMYFEPAKLKYKKSLRKMGLNESYDFIEMNFNSTRQ